MDGFDKLIEFEQMNKWSDEARAASAEARRSGGKGNEMSSHDKALRAEGFKPHGAESVHRVSGQRTQSYIHDGGRVAVVFHRPGEGTESHVTHMGSEKSDERPAKEHEKDLVSKGYSKLSEKSVDIVGNHGSRTLRFYERSDEKGNKHQAIIQTDQGVKGAKTIHRGRSERFK